VIVIFFHLLSHVEFSNVSFDSVEDSGNSTTLLSLPCELLRVSQNGPVGNRTRDPSVQGRYFTTRLQALIVSGAL
jgi:hypothetical protein